MQTQNAMQWNTTYTKLVWNLSLSLIALWSMSMNTHSCILPYDKAIKIWLTQHSKHSIISYDESLVLQLLSWIKFHPSCKIWHALCNTSLCTSLLPVTHRWRGSKGAPCPRAPFQSHWSHANTCYQYYMTAIVWSWVSQALLSKCRKTN